MIHELRLVCTDQIGDRVMNIRRYSDANPVGRDLVRAEIDAAKRRWEAAGFTNTRIEED
jgi:hypothetical protein